MTPQIEILLDKINALETELIEELQKQEKEFSYEIQKRRVFFEKNVIIRHKEYAKRLFNYISDAPLRHLVSVPLSGCVLSPRY